MVKCDEAVMKSSGFALYFVVHSSLCCVLYGFPSTALVPFII